MTAHISVVLKKIELVSDPLIRSKNIWCSASTLQKSQPPQVILPFFQWRCGFAWRTNRRIQSAGPAERFARAARRNSSRANIKCEKMSPYKVPRKYLSACDNTDCDCEVEEPDCVCFKWTAEMKVETCTYTQKTRMAATGKHLKSCYKRQHSGAPNFGASKVRDALLDEGFSKADLPPVKQIQIYICHEY